MTNFLLFALVFLVAYCLGLNIINLINKRLENISIKMPKIEVGAPQVSVQYDPTTGNFRTLPTTHFQTGGGEPDQSGGGHLLGLKENRPGGCGLPPIPTVCTTQPHTPCPGECSSACPATRPDRNPSTEVGTAHQGCATAKPEAKTATQPLCSDLKIAKEGCEGKTTADPICPEGQSSLDCSCDAECNQVYGRGANRCLNGKCECRFGTGKFCHLQPTYYLDPKLMSPEQVVKFKNKAKLENMTLQDYKNWLSLFESDLDSLSAVHRTNYFRMKRGDPIKHLPFLEEEDLNNPPDGWQSPGYRVDAEGTIEPSTMPEDERMFRIHGGRRLAPAGIFPESQDLIQVKMTMPGVEVDSPINYQFTPNVGKNSTGSVKKFAKTETPLQYTSYSDAFEPNRRYIEYSDKVRPFKTMFTSSWYQNRAPLLSELVGSSYFDPAYRCNA